MYRPIGLEGWYRILNIGFPYPAEYHDDIGFRFERNDALGGAGWGDSMIDAATNPRGIISFSVPAPGGVGARGSFRVDRGGARGDTAVSGVGGVMVPRPQAER